MKRKPSQTASATRKRATRSRPTPRWLLTSTELDQIAQRRCLQLLSVLSGEKSVSEAISEMQVSRGTYYQLESKALAGMLGALTPGAESTVGADGTPTGQLKMLEEKVKKLGSRETAGRAALATDTAGGEARPGEDGPWEAPWDPQRDTEVAGLEEGIAELDPDTAARIERAFDPDEGWRERAEKWSAS